MAGGAIPGNGLKPPRKAKKKRFRKIKPLETREFAAYNQHKLSKSSPCSEGEVDVRPGSCEDKRVSVVRSELFFSKAGLLLQRSLWSAPAGSVEVFILRQRTGRCQAWACGGELSFIGCVLLGQGD
mgnify:CR=1 FL=1